MTGIDDELARDRIERDSLNKTISDVETALLAVSTPGTRSVLNTFVQNAKGRVAVLDKHISEATAERETQAREQAAILSAAQREAALNAQEKETYCQFLAKDFFTKKDFGALEQFYFKSWDRLSDEGKNEMSHRVWEGIRHDEYRFTDLPQTVQEKEAQRVYSKLTSPSINQGSLTRIPENDRNDFLQAYGVGNREEAYHVLERDGFRQNISVEASKGAAHTAASAAKQLESKAILNDQPAGGKASAPESSAAASFKQNVAALKGITLVDAASNPSTTALPNAGTANVSGRSPV